MKNVVYQLIAFVCILAVGFTGLVLLTPQSDADPTEVKNVYHWDVYLFSDGSELWVLTKEEVFVTGWHEGSHYFSWTNSETNEEMDPVPFHECKIINEHRLTIIIVLD